MDYERVYREFIADRRTQERELKKGFERHHVVPRCLGGGNEQENLIKLSYGDHLFAHTLLARIYGGPLWDALFLMLSTGKYQGQSSRRHYDKARSHYILRVGDRSTRLWEDPDHRDHMKAVLTGRKDSVEVCHKKKIAAEKRCDDAWKRNLRQKMQGNKNGLGNTGGKWWKGRKQTPEHIAKRVAAFTANRNKNDAQRD